VQIAGDEPLVARRGVELPEAFLRADRAEQTNRLLIAGLSILLLLGLVVTGAMVVKRRRPIVLHDGTLDRRNTFILIGVLVVLATLTTLNSLPTQLFKYETAQPWGSFIGTIALGVLVSIPVTLVVFGVWLAFGAMRRRVGIPMLADEPSRSASNDMLAAGLGLGGIIYAMAHLSALFPRVGMPPTPKTVLNEAVPLVAGITDIPMNALMVVALIGIPVLAAAALTPRWSLRAVIAAVIGVLLVAVVWSSGAVDDFDLVSVTLVIAGVVAASVALIIVGTRSAWSWIVAALFYQALSGLREAGYGPVWQARTAGALTILVASALIALIARRAARSSQSPGIFT
jgi:hypothetical protein